MKNLHRMQAKRSWISITVILLLLVLIFVRLGLYTEGPTSHPEQESDEHGIHQDGEPMTEGPNRDPDYGDDEQKYVVVIDAGHGGRDPGASGVSGHDEKDFTLSLALRIVDLLEREDRFQAVLTRSEDVFLGLQERAEIANLYKAAAFISLHGNTFTDSKVNGVETYYWTSESRELAQDIHKQLIQHTGLKDRGVRKEDWIVLVHSEVPSILAELGYMTNKAEEKFLLSEEGQIRISEAIVQALKDYFKNENSDNPE